MTNYNDGKWHGWNGGECPVHPESKVEWYGEQGMYGPNGTVSGFHGTCRARDVRWAGCSPVAAFRVVKEYREPRERWAYLTHMHDSLADAEDFRAQVDANYPGRGYLDTPITHWREVV